MKLLGREVERPGPGERDREPGHRGVALVADHDVRLALADRPGHARVASTFATPSFSVSNLAWSVTSRSVPSL